MVKSQEFGEIPVQPLEVILFVEWNEQFLHRVFRPRNGVSVFPADVVLLEILVHLAGVAYVDGILLHVGEAQVEV